MEIEKIIIIKIKDKINYKLKRVIFLTKICTKCGKKLEDNANFCSFCGANLIDKKEIRNAEKKLKELTGGFLPSNTYQEILIPYKEVLFHDQFLNKYRAREKICYNGVS